MLFIFKLLRFLIRKSKSVQKNIERVALIKSIESAGGSVGKCLEIGNDVTISGLDKLEIGDNVSIGTGAFIRADGGLKIGNNVVISRNLVMYTVSHDYEGAKLPFDDRNINGPIIIEDNVWIGMNVTISPGTIIREGAIIGLGTRVWGEIKPLEIVGSATPKVIKRRNINHYRSLVKKDEK